MKFRDNSASFCLAIKIVSWLQGTIWLSEKFLTLHLETWRPSEPCKSTDKLKNKAHNPWKTNKTVIRVRVEKKQQFNRKNEDRKIYGQKQPIPQRSDRPGDILDSTHDLELRVSQASESWLHVPGWRDKRKQHRPGVPQKSLFPKAN